jgi:GntR family transcriptional regulator
MTGYNKLMNDAIGQPLYAQLAEILKNQILSRRWEPGFKLPSERELCEQYNVSRITVRKALNDLAVQNLIHSVPGKGNFVSLPQMREPLRPLSSFTEDMSRRGYIPYSRIMKAEIFRADQAAAEKLKVPQGTEVILLERLRMVAPDQIAIAIQKTLLPHFRCPNLLDFDLEKRSLFEVLRQEYHLVLSRAETIISARMANPLEVEQLAITKPAAVLVSDQVTYLDSGEIIEFVNTVFRSDLYQLSVMM